MRDTARKTLYLLRDESRLKWAMVLIFAIVVTGIEALGALLVFLLLGMVAAPDAPLDLPLAGNLENLSFVGDRASLLAWLAGAIAVFFVFRGVLLMVQIYVQDRLAQNAGARLSIRLLDSYLDMPYQLHLRRNSAELIRNAYESTRSITVEVLIPTVRLVSHLVLTIGMLAVLCYAAPLATLFAVGFLGPLVWLLFRVIQPRMKALGRKRQRVTTELLKILQQTLHGIREVVLFQRTAFFKRLYAKKQISAARIAYVSRVAQEVPRVLIETTLVVFIACFFLFSVVVEQSAQQALAVLGLFAYAALRLQPSLHKITQSLNLIRFAGAAVDNVCEDLKAAETAAAAHRAADPVSDLPGDQRGLHEIVLDRVGFAYAEDADPVLREIDLRIGPGESVGIVGPTGGGKSTLLDIITGLLRPTTGRVLVDGVDLRECVSAWQGQLGVVPQTVFLVDDTLRRNIVFGVPDSEIDEEQVSAAVQLAQLGEFVEELPDGLDTMVGERGLRLSGGQRQRVAIARALYRSPTVLVFDEGTSALDNITEAEFMEALERLGGSRTLITVAHRLTTVRNCDRILIVEGGRIVDAGRFGELAIRNSRFRESLERAR